MKLCTREEGGREEVGRRGEGGEKKCSGKVLEEELPEECWQEWLKRVREMFPLRSNIETERQRKK